MEELDRPMDRIFNAEKPRHSAESICDYFYPLTELPETQSAKNWAIPQFSMEFLN